MEEFNDALILAGRSKEKILRKQKDRQRAKRKCGTVTDQSDVGCNDDDDDDDVESYTADQLDVEQSSSAPLSRVCVHADEEAEELRFEEIDGENDEAIHDEEMNETEIVEDLLDVAVNGPLHLHTDQTSIEFSMSFLHFVRSENIGKSRSNQLLQIIRSILPEPNNFPSSMKNILSHLNIDENLFTKKAVCVSCKIDIFDLRVVRCNNCNNTDESTYAFIYNANPRVLISMLIHRHCQSMERFKETFTRTTDQNRIPDIPFGRTYQSFLQNLTGNKFVNIILHLDGKNDSFDRTKHSIGCLFALACIGIGLSKSSKIKL